MIFNTALDADNSPSLKTNTLKKVYSIMEDHDLSDIFRIRNPDMQRYTWRQKTPLIQHRLDYFLISNELQEDVEHIDILRSVASDHSVVHLKFALSGQNSRGKSYWKFNNSLIEVTNFVESMKVKIKEVMQEISETDDPRVSWEFLKYKMRQFARQYSVIRASGRREKRITLEKKVYDLERAISESTDPNLVQEYNDAKEELGKLSDYITQGIILRSRAKWYEEGEKPSSYFLRLEKRNKSKSHIRKLIVDDNIEKIETDDSAILYELRKSYSTLY